MLQALCLCLDNCIMDYKIRSTELHMLVDCLYVCYVSNELVTFSSVIKIVYCLTSLNNIVDPVFVCLIS